jgi:hypothetical protein
MATMAPDTDVARRTRIERQRRLPFSKAVEISLKGIKVRFWRSMLTVSSIILAIAFLMWQLTSAEIVRNLDSLSRETVPLDPLNPKGPQVSRVNRDAAPLKETADALADAAARHEAEIKPVQDASETADKRLAAGIALAAVDEAARRLAQDQRKLEAAQDAFRLVQERKAREGVEPPDFEQKRSDRDVAQSHVDEAQTRLAAAVKAANQAKIDFPGLQPAPEGAPEYNHLLDERNAARRAKERAERQLETLTDRADRAKKRYEAATLANLKRLLEVRGEQSVEQRPIRFLNLQLSPSRLWIIGLALLVCLVGITNAMLMSVTERYREIGTMKCLGALDSFIVKIFLLESSFQGMIGVLLGIVLGLVLALAVQIGNFGGFVLEYFPAAGLVKWAGVAFIVGALLAVLGGILPARRAARMQPVDAMRIEE